MKRYIFLILAFVMLFFCISDVFADSVFTDVPTDHWAYEHIQFFYNGGIVNGVGNGVFAPNDFVTREQLAKMISILYGRDNYTPARQAFTDVTSDMWSYAYIDSVKDYLVGYSKADGTSFYNPAEIATREDVAYALVKISGIYNEVFPDNVVLAEYADGDTVTYNRIDFVSVAVKSGLMQGYDGYLRPKDGITRAETVTLLYRTIQQPEPEFVPETETEIPTVEEEAPVSEAVDMEAIYAVTEINGFEAWGNIRLNCATSAKITYSDFSFGEGSYTIEIVETESITSDEIAGMFMITLDGETVADGVKGKIINYNGDNTQILSNDGEWNIKMEIAD